jgi:hypothetical protein
VECFDDGLELLEAAEGLELEGSPTSDHAPKTEGYDYFLDFHLTKIGYDNGYWATFRVFKRDPDEGRPHGLQNSLALLDEHDNRILSFDNSHPVSVGSGPARRSKKPKTFDHIDRRGQESVPYTLTTPYKLLEDFFAEVDAILKKEGVS